MDGITRVITTLSCMVSGILLFTFGYFGLLLSFSAYPTTLWVLALWLLGVCGFIGLYRTNEVVRRGAESEIKTTLMLLFLGMIGATVFTAVLYPIVFRIAFQFTNSSISIPFAILILIFPILPMVGGTLCIRHLRIALRSTGNEKRERKFSRLALATLLIPVVLVLARITLQESVILYYGHDLAEKADKSAEQLSAGRPYCLIRSGTAKSFDDLNPRSIIINALNQRFGLHALRNWGKQPHFGIDIEGRPYWWSFREGRFVELPTYAGSHSRYICTRDLQPWS